MTVRRVAIGIGCLIAAWLIAMLVIGAVYAERISQRVTEQLGESLQASATVGSSDLAMVRGRLALGSLRVRKNNEVGTLALDVDDVRCELPPLGGAMFDRSCSELAVRGVRLEASTAAVFQLRNPKRPPIRVDHVVIDDAVFTFAPRAMVSSLGRVAIHIDHAEAGPTVFKTPLSWLFAMTTLHARLELPANVTLAVVYERGELSVTGTLFGDRPVTISAPLPEPKGDGRAEIRQLGDMGVELAEKLVVRRANDWIRSKL